ncbi:metallophosphoesterase family protein [Serratia plymuthica]|uniref:metallophosphoesterase family protein n=1 Tax=Serratia plymuthica TaxID=82996 RepID=UPI003DA5F352
MKIGVISDIHEDVVRLEESLNLLESLGADEVICLGDIVGYSVPFYGYLATRDANRCLDLVQRHCSEVVIGNHDLFAIRKLPSHAAGFSYPEDWYRRSFAERKRLADGKVFLYEDHELPSLLNDNSLCYLHSLPEIIVKPFATHNVLLSHYADPDITGSCTFEVSHHHHLADHFATMGRHQCLHGLSGNDHIPGMKIFTPGQVWQTGFERHELGQSPTWITGPTVSRGTMANGVMIYDSEAMTLSAVALGTPLHHLPASI